MKLWDVENNKGDYDTKRGIWKMLANIGLVKREEVPPPWEEYKKEQERGRDS